MRMLIVDDEPDMLFLMRSVLELEGDLDVAAEATDGDEAVSAWRSNPFDVIVLDQRMPRMAGLVAAEEILSTAPDQAIIMCSAYMEEEERAQATALGVRRCLDKYELAQLPAAVRAVLDSLPLNGAAAG